MAVRWHTVGRLVLLIVLVVVMVTASVMLPVEKVLRNFIVWLKNDVGPWGPLVLILAYIPSSVLAIPGSILTLGGGYLFGLPLGFAADSIGSTAGAAAAFLVGRTIGRAYVVSKVRAYPRFTAIATAIELSGFKIVFLLRLVPMLPFNVLNYLLSITPLNVSTYTLASWLGMMPSTLVLVYVGTTLKSIQDIIHGGGEPPSKWKWAFVVVGLLFSVAILSLVTAIAKKSLKKVLEEQSMTSPAGTEVAAAAETVIVLPSPGSEAGDKHSNETFKEPLLVRLHGPSPAATVSPRYDDLP
ncbi:hypothetical protein CBR_g47968 [Chara braunii]|uniref:VTT domain-containing protein n=1 Tax=Chara braunii TaxID=69332 RepID=A0A388M1N8_CHABU|nr:hypothetical protein CBR_g47968 [Chara braunii]|eukprot:GBG88497.1 hypothetical protein CBR_g47968 [Chara braunii]